MIITRKKKKKKAEMGQASWGSRGCNFKQSGQRRRPQNLTFECKYLKEVRKQANHNSSCKGLEAIIYLECSRNHRDIIVARREWAKWKRWWGREGGLTDHDTDFSAFPLGEIRIHLEGLGRTVIWHWNLVWLLCWEWTVSRQGEK